MESCAYDLGADTATTTSSIRQVNPTISGEVWMQDHVEKPTLTAGLNIAGQAVYGSPLYLAISDKTEEAAALGDQHSSVGKERETPRVIEPLRYVHETKRMELRIKRLVRGGRGCDGE